MRCPKCKCEKSKVKKTDHRPEGHTLRHRVCEGCGCVFETAEAEIGIVEQK